MKTIPLCMIGFGNVGQAFARLLLRKKEVMIKENGVQFFITAIGTGRHGTAINTDGLNIERALLLIQEGKELSELTQHTELPSTDEILRASQAKIMLENTPVNYRSGQPALDHIRAALNQGMHTITANKGSVLHGYRSLRQLAEQNGVQFLFESTVMDGAPIFSLFKKTLPAIELMGFEGILNSCTNLLLERMEGGEDFEQAVEYARSIGITETDPSGDIDGWDAAIKTALLVNILMGHDMTIDEVQRMGIRDITMEEIRLAKSQGKRWKLLCRAEREEGKVKASVHPEMVNAQSPFFSVNGTSSMVVFHTDCLPGLGILESNPGPETTAFGLLSDLLTITGR
jgi:homoserine dehydrogenase